jgi:diguanylate cyclase (GGDEF)-like protein
MDMHQPTFADAAMPPLLEPLLGVHSAPTSGWLADAAATAAERGLGALYAVLYLMDSSGQLVGERPASKERMRALARVQQALQADLTRLRFYPGERSALASTMRGGRAAAHSELSRAIPLNVDAEVLDIGQRRLGITQAWLAPLQWDGESLGLLLLLMPERPPAPLAHAELLGRHVAVAVNNLREKDAGRKRGEIDAVRWVYDERRFSEQLAQEIRRAQRHGRPLSILLLRLQNLDQLRVRYGRFLAEQVLRRVAGRLDDAMRDTDFLGASREDGFAAILVETDGEGAGRAEERLMTGLDPMEALPHAGLTGLGVRLSCATATLPQDGESAEELTAVAEARLGQRETGVEDAASAG